MKKILLTGASGKLGGAIVSSGKFQNLLTPDSKELDICDVNKVENYFEKEHFDIIIHAAAMARIVQGEKEPSNAIRTNIIGTSNLVLGVLTKHEKGGNVRLIYISSDGVYSGENGSYNEIGPAIPKTKYGWSKLGGECAVNIAPDHCIIRTRFFDPTTIPFDTSADDIYTSKIPLSSLVNYIYQLTFSDFIGTINVGGEKISDYQCYKKFKPHIISCSREDIQKEVSFEVPKDISMEIKLLKKMVKFTSDN